jgi:excinuclease ABC subunit A
VLVIEHNLDVIKTADWIVDMGPEGGSRGGLVVAEGTPEQVAAHPDSFTGEFLAPLLEGTSARLAKRPRKATAAAKTAPAKKTPATRTSTKKAVAKKAVANKTARKAAPRKR